MSLINQMLKDLEQRGAEVAVTSVTDFEKVVSSKNKSKASPFKSTQSIKIMSALILLTGMAYIWVQSKSGHSYHADENNTKVLFSSNQQKNTPSPAKFTTNSEPTPSLTSKPILVDGINTKPLEIKMPIQPRPEPEVHAIPTPPALSQKREPVTEPFESTPDSASVKPNELLNRNSPPSEKSIFHEHANNNPNVKAKLENIVVSKQITPIQKSGNFYRLALLHLQQGRVSEAQSYLTQAIDEFPANHDARQTLAGLFVDNKHNDDAIEILSAGVNLAPEQSSFRIALSRLLVEKGDGIGALKILEQGLVYADDNADYQGFIAALLQRAERHQEAISHYSAALSINSNMPTALIGLGISLQATGQYQHANEAFKRAQTGSTLSPELAIFVDQRLKQINQHLEK